MVPQTVINVELQDSAEDHTISTNSYNAGECPPKNFYWVMCPYYSLGRDQLVSMAVGFKSFGGVTYNTVAQNLTGLMAAGSAG